MDFGVLNKWSVTPHVTGPVGWWGLTGSLAPSTGSQAVPEFQR